MTDAEKLILIHYHEVGLKGKNRGRFENQLISNISKTMKDVPTGQVRRIGGRLYLELTEDSPLDTIRERKSTLDRSRLPHAEPTNHSPSIRTTSIGMSVHTSRRSRRRTSGWTIRI
jgi:hypothetical protein